MKIYTISVTEAEISVLNYATLVHLGKVIAHIDSIPPNGHEMIQAYDNLVLVEELRSKIMRALKDG